VTGGDRFLLLSGCGCIEGRASFVAVVFLLRLRAGAGLEIHQAQSDLKSALCMPGIKPQCRLRFVLR